MWNRLPPYATDLPPKRRTLIASLAVNLLVVAVIVLGLSLVLSVAGLM